MPPEGAARVVAIHIASHAGMPPQPVQSVRAIAGRGLAGDRYEAGAGTWSQRPGGGRQLTLIAAEDLDAVARERGLRIDPAASRRNILTMGINLPDLVGRRFRVGSALCLGIRLCEPCAYLEAKTQPGVLEALVHRGGLRADILESGDIAVGDLMGVAEDA
jgi:MOSC domain-containing protein YiiM